MPVKTTIKERIAIALKRSDKSQTDLAKLMGLAQATVNAMLSKESGLDSIKYLQAVETLTGYCFEWLRTGNGPEKLSDKGSSDIDEQTLFFLRDKLKTKDDLIEELRGRIADMKKYTDVLEKQLTEKKKTSS